MSERVSDRVSLCSRWLYALCYRHLQVAGKFLKRQVPVAASSGAIGTEHRHFTNWGGGINYLSGLNGL